MANRKSDDDDEKFYGLKDLYNELFRCRDFEIDHLWQRSVFLGAFLLAIAAGYGAFVNDHIDAIFSAPVKQESDCSVKIESEQYEIEAVKTANRDNDISSECFHGICLCLAGLGIVFSQLWIMMAKGSKRWYEKYEACIAFYYTDESDFEVKKALFGVETAKLIESKKIHFFTNLKDRPVNNSLLSTKGGYYSVSRINIVVGLVVGFAWMVITGVHFYNLIESMCENRIAMTVAVSVVSVVTYSCVLRWILVFFVRSEDD